MATEYNDNDLIVKSLSSNFIYGNGSGLTGIVTGDTPATTLVRTSSANWDSTFTNVQTNSATYIINGGNAGTANIAIGTNDNYDLTLETNSIPRVTILSAGNVGIGTTIPNERLTVSGNISAIGTHTFVQPLSTSGLPVLTITQAGSGNALTVSGRISSTEILTNRFVSNDQLYYSTDSRTSLLSTLTGTLLTCHLSALSGNYDEGQFLGRVKLTQNNNRLTNIGVTWVARESNRSWRSVCMSSDGKYQTAVVQNEPIYISLDYGNTWVARESNRNWQSVCMSSDGKYQTAGVDNGQIYISSDYGNNWVARGSGRRWFSVCMSSDGKYQTAAEGGFGPPVSLHISSDYGNTWNIALNSVALWSSVCMSSDGKYQTAVSNISSDRRIYISSDYGNTWVARESNRNWSSVCMSSDGKYQTAVAGQIYISTDYGNNWVARGSNGVWSSVCMSSDGKYQTAVDNFPGRIYISLDYGNTWVARESDRSWRSVCMSSDGKYQTAVVSGGQIYISVADEMVAGNLTTIGSISSTGVVFASGGNSNNWNSVFSTVQSNSAAYIVAGGNSRGSNILIGSNDNFNLDLETNNTSRITILNTGNVGIGTTAPTQRLTVSGNISATNVVFAENASNAGYIWNTTSNTQAIVNKGAYGNGMFLFPVFSSNAVIKSEDGVNWKTITTSHAYGDVCFGNGLFIALAYGTGVPTIGRVYRSINGEIWSPTTLTISNSANNWSSITYGNGLFVAVSYDGTNRVMTSPDGITWTERTAAEANSWQSVTYGNGLFVAVAGSGTNRVMTSPDGITWTARTAAEANGWLSVIYGNGLFVAVSSTGTNRVMTSPDGITWTVRTAAEANQWSCIAYGNGLFVAVSSNGTNRVMTSPNGITWTARSSMSTTNALYSIVYGNQIFVAGGVGGPLVSGKATSSVEIISNIRQGDSILYGNYTVAGQISSTGVAYVSAVDCLDGVILKAPNSSKWRIIVTDTGQLSTISI